MANAKKCDLCGSYYDIKFNKDCGFKIYCMSNHIDKRITLNRECCPECMEKIKDVIESLIKPMVTEE